MPVPDSTKSSSYTEPYILTVFPDVAVVKFVVVSALVTFAIAIDGT